MPIVAHLNRLQDVANRVSTRPQKWVLLNTRDKASPDRVLEDVSRDAQRGFFCAKRSLESVPLPQRFRERLLEVKCGELLCPGDEPTAI